MMSFAGVTGAGKIRLAILASTVTCTHPAGAQTLGLIRELGPQFEITVFGSVVEDSIRQRITFVPLPIPTNSPLLLLYTIQYLVYAWVLWRYRLFRNFDLVLCVEASAPSANVAVFHSLGAAQDALVRKGYLQYAGWRRYYYKVLRVLGIAMERRLLGSKQLKAVIAVSQGLADDLHAAYRVKAEIVVIENAIDPKRFVFQDNTREVLRGRLGIGNHEFIGATCSLGNWALKGLHILLVGMALSSGLYRTSFHFITQLIFLYCQPRMKLGPW
jgi:glycosyltransferase involved in cell wall biosynthesis